jgi:hypothetical protein
MPGRIVHLHLSWDARIQGRPSSNPKIEPIHTCSDDGLLRPLERLLEQAGIEISESAWFSVVLTATRTGARAATPSPSHLPLAGVAPGS